MTRYKRWLPLVIILVLMTGVYISGITEYISFEELKAHRQSIVHFVSKHWLLTPLLFIGAYVCVIALSMPIGIYLSLLGGFLFIQPLSTIYVLFGATLGAAIIFLVAKTAFGDFLRGKVEGRIEKMRYEFEYHSVSYLLFLRLVPVFPFWLVNIAPAFLNVRLSTFIWTTALGIAPSTFVYTEAGRGIGAILDAGEELSIASIFNWHVKLALIALGIVVLIPVAVKKMRKKHDR